MSLITQDSLVYQFQRISSYIFIRFHAYFESSKPLLKQINHVLKQYFQTFERGFRSLYWLFAPKLIFKMMLRHTVLFALMFAIPPFIRFTIKPLWIVVQYRIILKLVMGREWVTKYTEINKQCHEESTTYDEYVKHGLKLDELSGYDSWRINKTSKLYRYQRIQEDVIELAKFRATDNMSTNRVRSLMEFIRSRRIERDYCGITNPKLYAKTTCGTKTLIEDYIDSMCQSLHYISRSNAIPLEEKMSFFEELRHVLGRTALCLSGGATFAMYHIGVLRTLSRKNLLPRVITGASGGSFFAAMVCSKTDDELDDMNMLIQSALRIKLYHDTDHPTWRHVWSVPFTRFMKTGYALDVSVPRSYFRAELGEVTFLEAYQKTGRILNISVSGAEGCAIPRLLNYLTAPNVLIWSAVTASIAVPNVFAPQELYIKSPNTNRILTVFLEGVKFSDGSMTHDLPMHKIAQLFNVDNFIVSQTNPHMVKFLFNSIVAPIPLFDTIFTFLGNEFHHYLSTILVNVGGIRLVNDFLTQKWTGNVTVVPSVPIGNYAFLLSNMTPNYLKTMYRSGSKATFKHISRLQAMCAVEFTVDECLKHLKAQYNWRDFSSFVLRKSNVI
eukprot:220697_1